MGVEHEVASEAPSSIADALRQESELSARIAKVEYVDTQPVNGLLVLAEKRKQGGPAAVRKFLLGASDCVEVVPLEIAALIRMMNDHGYKSVDEVLDAVTTLSGTNARITQ